MAADFQTVDHSGAGPDGLKETGSRTAGVRRRGAPPCERISRLSSRRTQLAAAEAAINRYAAVIARVRRGMR